MYIFIALFLVTGLCMPEQAGINHQSFQTGIVQVQAAETETESEPSSQYKEGYEDGWQEGWKDGYKVGEESSYEEGYEEGYEDGCEAGYNAGEDSTIGFFVEYYELDEGIEESLRANKYWERVVEEEGGNVDSDYVEFYIEELPEYPSN